jgi:peptidoglycan-N-acetylglucosamine deacetylase
MKLYWAKKPGFIKRLFCNQTWSIPNKDNKIYLTFDDGPIPEVTEWVLKVLKESNIKATFFCIGDNIRKFPHIFQKVISEGHIIGNHTCNHLNGWKTNNDDYIENVNQCFEDYKLNTVNVALFRPPYGKIKPSQSIQLRKLGYKIIMWDVLSADFDQRISPEKCLQNVIKNVESGSIIVFHDSKKAAENLQYALPLAIKILKEKGFVFDVIPID